jgi:penicillin-binding protein 1A
LELSRNLMTIRIAQQIGMDRIAAYAERFGVYQNMPHHLSYALGAGETTLYDMVAAYGMFANGGKRVRPTVVDRIQDRNGNTLYAHDPRLCQGCRVDGAEPRGEPLLFDQRAQIMNPVTAYQIVSILEGVVARGTASRTVGGLGFPVAGKTGTTNDAKDAWFIGFTSDLVAGCFIGYDNPQPMGRSAYGGTLCGPVFREFMAEAMKDRVPGAFHAPETGGMVTVKIDRLTGERLADDASGPDVIVEVFQQGSEPELYAEASAIAGDEVLFGNFGGDLPFAFAGEGAESGYGTGALPPTSEGPADPAGRPRPTGPSVGLGTGGLY